MLKKLGLSAIALFGIMLIAPAQQAKAGVHFGVGVGVAPAVPYGYVAPPAPDPYYAPPYDPYAYNYSPYVNPYPIAPTYVYPNYGYYGGWGGGWGHGWGGGHEYRGGWGGRREFRGGGHFGGGHRR